MLPAPSCSRQPPTGTYSTYSEQVRTMPITPPKKYGRDMPSDSLSHHCSIIASGGSRGAPSAACMPGTSTQNLNRVRVAWCGMRSEVQWRSLGATEQACDPLSKACNAILTPSRVCNGGLTKNCDHNAGSTMRPACVRIVRCVC